MPVVWVAMPWRMVYGYQRFVRAYSLYIPVVQVANLYVQGTLVHHVLYLSPQNTVVHYLWQYRCRQNTIINLRFIRSRYHISCLQYAVWNDQTIIASCLRQEFEIASVHFKADDSMQQSMLSKICLAEMVVNDAGSCHEVLIMGGIVRTCPVMCSGPSC